MFASHPPPPSLIMFTYVGDVMMRGIEKTSQIEIILEDFNLNERRKYLIDYPYKATMNY